MKRKNIFAVWLLIVSLIVTMIPVYGEETEAGMTVTESGTMPSEAGLTEVQSLSLEPLSEVVTEAGTTTAETVLTEAPTTEAALTEVATTEAASTEVTTTEAPTTEAALTEAPTTEAASTEAPTTESASTEASTTETVSTEAATTEATSSEMPSTEDASTDSEAETTVEAESSPDAAEESSSEQTSSEEMSSEEVSSEEASSEEISSEEETSEEESTEENPWAGYDEYDIELLLYFMSMTMPLDLGDVQQIVSLTSCRIEGNSVVVSGQMNDYFTTWDDKIYLFEQSMYESDISGEPVASASLNKGETFQFQIPFDRNGNDLRLYSKFYAGVKLRSGEYYSLSDGRYITNPEVLAANQSPYPVARSKKGIFSELYWGTDLDELDVSHTTVNILITHLIAGDDFTYEYKGKTYQFSAGYVDWLDNTLRMMQKNNITVYGILLAWPNTGLFDYPGISASVGTYHGWNVITEEGIEYVSAILNFLGERYGRADNAYGHIANWIVGNEVNADTNWNYTGHQPVAEYAQIYANMMRITYQTMKSNCAHARVYMPLDMFWKNSSSSTRYDGKDMVDLVNIYLKAEGDMAWGVAYHPYGNPLTEPEWWNDHSEQSENAGFISMQNLSVLTDYLQKSSLRDPDGSVKKVILSEQGFTSWSANQGDVEWKSAAAYAYAYYVAEANPYIQAIIVMRQKDAGLEVKDGLHQGIWYDDTTKDFCTFAKKPVWTVWKYIDTDKGFEYTDSLAPIVGLKSFSGIYGSIMASKTHSVSSGKGGYAYDFEKVFAFPGSWQAEYMMSEMEVNGGTIIAKAKENNPFTYSGIVWNGYADFTSAPIFGFHFTGMAGENQNLRVRLRFTSGQNVYETEMAVQKELTQKLYADLSNWSGKASVNKIQIWVQQDDMNTWENGSFIISNIVSAAGIKEQPTPRIEITEASAWSDSTTDFEVSCKTSGTAGLDRVEFTAWNIRKGTESAVTVEGTINGNQASAKFDIESFENETGAYKVRIVAYNTDGLASKEKLVSVTVKGQTEALVIDNGYITNITPESFMINVEASSDFGIAKTSKVAVWASNGGRDDLLWYSLAFVDGKAMLTVQTDNHSGESGEYVCHAYVTDNSGVTKVYPMTATIPSRNPVITSASVDHVTVEGYTVTCTFDCYYGVKSVEMPSWSDVNDKDDIIWEPAEVSGNTATYTVRVKDHNHDSGLYRTHIYVYDNKDNFSCRELEIKIPESNGIKRNPTIQSLKTSEVTSGGYRVTATFAAPNGVANVAIGAWTENKGTDDIVWYVASVKDNTATAYIPVSYHNNESGKYITKVTVYDKMENEISQETSVAVPARKVNPEIISLKVTDVTSKGYRVTCTFDAPMGLKEVRMPTWTDQHNQGGKEQDDLIWHLASISGNTATYYVSTSEHNGESGKYITHVYVYDLAGKNALEGLEVIVPKKDSGSTGEDSGSTGGDSGNTGEDSGSTGGNTGIVKPNPSAVYNGVEYRLVFNAEYYLAKYPDLRRAFGTNRGLALSHFVNNGMKEGRQASAGFDLNFYRANYPDLRQAFGNNNVSYYMHYINNGYKENRVASAEQLNPSVPEEKPTQPEEKPTQPEEKPTQPEEKPTQPEEKPTQPEEKPDEPIIPGSGTTIHNGIDYSLVFDASYYLNRYPDLKAAFGNNATAAFNHFISNGMKEGRQAKATFNVNAYRSRYMDLQRAFGSNLIAYYQHYIQNGYAEKRIGN